MIGVTLNDIRLVLLGTNNFLFWVLFLVFGNLASNFTAFVKFVMGLGKSGSFEK